MIDRRPAWFTGSLEEFETLAELMNRMCDAERLRRRGLLARSTGQACLLAGLVLLGSPLLATGATSAASTSLLQSTLLQSVLAASLALVVLFECPRFIEGHLSAVKLHARFATLATAVVQRNGFDDGASAPHAEHARLYRELQRFAHARRHRRVVVPALLRAGFVVIAPRNQPAAAG